MKYKYLYFLSAMIFSVSLYGQNRTYITLRECLVQGMENNYGILITKNQSRISANNVTRGNAGFLPDAGVALGYDGTLTNIDRQLSEGGSTDYQNINNNTLSGSVNVDWTIFEGFSAQTNYKRLKQLQQMGELNVRLQIENFISDFTSEYYNYIRQLIRLKNLKYAVELSTERVRIVQARYEIGALSRMDLQQANVDLNTDKSQLIKQYEVLHNLRATLNKMIVNQDPATPLMPADSVITYDAGLDMETIWQNVIDHNIYLEISRKGRELAGLDYQSVKSRNYPYLKFSTGYSYTGTWYDKQQGYSSYDNQQTRGFNYGLSLGYTLFDGLNRKRELTNTRIEQANKELEYEQTKLALNTDLSNFWMAYRNNMDLVSLEKDNLETARDNYDMAIERYKLGQLSGIELREAQSSLLEAEERLVQAQFDTKLCEITLLQIGGQITAYLNVND